MNRPILLKEALTALGLLVLCWYIWSEYQSQTQWVGRIVVSLNGDPKEGIIIMPNLHIGIRKDRKMVIRNLP